MKILAFTTSYPRSRDDDASIFVHRLYKALSDSAEITVAAPLDHGEERREERDGVRIRWFRYLPLFQQRLVYGAGLLPNLKRYPWRAFELPLLVLRLTAIGVRCRREFDVIHANWILSGCAAYLTKLLTGTPYVVTLRGSDTMLFRVVVARWLSAPALRSASFVTTVSNQMVQETLAAFPWLEGKVRCIENGVEAETGSNEPFPDLPQKYLAVVGSVIPRKRVELAIELIAKSQLKSFSLVVCGKLEDPGYYSRLQALATRLGVSARVQFLGMVSPERIGVILRGSTALLACSEYEGRPNAVLEALSSRCLVLASDIPAHREILRDGAAGILFEPTALDAAASKLAGTIESETERSALIARGSESVAASTWKAAAGRYLELFAKATATQG